MGWNRPDIRPSSSRGQVAVARRLHTNGIHVGKLELVFLGQGPGVGGRMDLGDLCLVTGGFSTLLGAMPLARADAASTTADTVRASRPRSRGQASCHRSTTCSRRSTCDRRATWSSCTHSPTSNGAAGRRTQSPRVGQMVCPGLPTSARCWYRFVVGHGLPSAARSRPDPTSAAVCPSPASRRRLPATPESTVVRGVDERSLCCWRRRRPGCSVGL